MKLTDILKRAAELGASDLFLIPGLPLSYKLNGRVMRQSAQPMPTEETAAAVRELYALAGGRSMERLEREGDDLFSFSAAGLPRCRASAFLQRGEKAAVLRLLWPALSDIGRLHLPEGVLKVASLSRGLVLVTGPAGGGKSTTLACIVDEINRLRGGHILTLEEPIEYLYPQRQGLVTQREIGSDSASYETALRAAVWQAPDVLLIGELQTSAGILAALSAAETGRLVLTTLPSMGAANAIEYLIGSFTPEAREQVRTRLAAAAAAIVSQQLLPTLDGREEPAFEIMFPNRALRDMIREGKTRQMDSVIRASADAGMALMDDWMLGLYRRSVLSRDTLLERCMSPDVMERRIRERE